MKILFSHLSMFCSASCSVETIVTLLCPMQVSLLHTSLQATTSHRSGDTQHWMAAMETVVVDEEALEKEYCQCMEQLKFDEAELMVRKSLGLQI